MNRRERVLMSEIAQGTCVALLVLLLAGIVRGACPRQNIFLIDKEGIVLRVSHYPGMEEKILVQWLEKMEKGDHP